MSDVTTQEPGEARGAATSPRPSYGTLAVLAALGGGVALAAWQLRRAGLGGHSRSGQAGRPLLYHPSMERVEPEEERAIASLVETMRHINETTFAEYHHAVRATHAKSHGLLVGTLRVAKGLPFHLAHGLFAQAESYPVVMRLSTQPGDLLDDNVSSTRGLALKVIGVKGKRLPGSEGQVTQDFVMQDAPVFQSPDAGSFVRRFKLLGATANTGQEWKKAFSLLMRGVESLVERAGGFSQTLRSLGGHPITHILGETYYTQAPLLYGPFIAKLSMVPASGSLERLIGRPLDLTGKPDGLREAVVDFFRTRGGVWELRAQLCTNLERMPIENASVRWPEELSPYVPVARVTVPPQEAWSEERSKAIDDGMSFNPWHGLAAHRPLGSIMRARKVVYEASARFREEHNQRAIREPQSIEEILAAEISDARSVRR